MAKPIDPKKIAKSKQVPTTGKTSGSGKPIRGKDVTFRTADGRAVGHGGVGGSARGSRLRVIGDVFRAVTGKHRKNG